MTTPAEQIEELEQRLKDLEDTTLRVAALLDRLAQQLLAQSKQIAALQETAHKHKE